MGFELILKEKPEVTKDVEEIRTFSTKILLDRKMCIICSFSSRKFSIAIEVWIRNRRFECENVWNSINQPNTFRINSFETIRSLLIGEEIVDYPSYNSSSCLESIWFKYLLKDKNFRLRFILSGIMALGQHRMKPSVWYKVINNQ